MFIYEYRLEHNPFIHGRARSVFVSHSYQQTAARITRLLNGDLQCLFLTGARGVGKTTIVESLVANAEDVTVGRVQPQTRDPVELLQLLLRELGLGDVEGSANELRRILEVFLSHQAAHGRRSLIFADGVETDSPEVLRELESLVLVRTRGVPVVQMILTTRNEELVASLMGRHDGSSRARAMHQRLLGLTLEETTAYLRVGVEGAGCSWFQELFPEELMVHIQAFTQGVVEDVDLLCGAALDALAALPRDSHQPPKLSLGLLRTAAADLALRYDARAWKLQHEEALEPGAIRESRHDALRIDVAQLIVSSCGRKVGKVMLNRPRMILGRDRSCDISLDSGYVSRYQNLFMETRDGWILIDLNSTNGCFVNGRRVNEHRLQDGDLISLGQHQLRFSGAPLEASRAG